MAIKKPAWQAAGPFISGLTKLHNNLMLACASKKQDVSLAFQESVRLISSSSSTAMAMSQLNISS
jgi:hypothetical protein